MTWRSDKIETDGDVPALLGDIVIAAETVMREADDDADTCG